MSNENQPARNRIPCDRPCPTCGSSDTIVENGKMNVAEQRYCRRYRCRDCGTAYWDHEPTPGAAGRIANAKKKPKPTSTASEDPELAGLDGLDELRAAEAEQEKRKGLNVWGRKLKKERSWWTRPAVYGGESWE
jgi:rubredoxin